MYEAELMWFEAFPSLGASPVMAPTDDERLKDLATGIFHGHAKALFLVGPYWVAIHLASDGGGPLELAQYRVSLLPTPTKPRPVRPTSDTRRIPLHEMVLTTRRRYAERMRQFATMETGDEDPRLEAVLVRMRDAARAHLDAPTRSRMGRPPLSSDDLFQTAEAYVLAERSGHDPVNAVMRATELTSRSGAYKRIRQARESGHIEFVRIYLHETEQED
jgi:hypothetical protein